MSKNVLYPPPAFRLLAPKPIIIALCKRHLIRFDIGIDGKPFLFHQQQHGDDHLSNGASGILQPCRSIGIEYLDCTVDRFMICFTHLAQATQKPQTI